MKTSDKSVIWNIIFIIAAIICLLFMDSCSMQMDREMHNMEVLEGEYCYDRDTKIIYFETRTGRYSKNLNFTPYISPNGNYYTYDESTDQWIELTE